MNRRLLLSIAAPALLAGCGNMLKPITDPTNPAGPPTTQLQLDIQGIATAMTLTVSNLEQSGKITGADSTKINAYVDELQVASSMLANAASDQTAPIATKVVNAIEAIANSLNSVPGLPAAATATLGWVGALLPLIMAAAHMASTPKLKASTSPAEARRKLGIASTAR